MYGFDTARGKAAKQPEEIKAAEIAYLTKMLEEYKTTPGAVQFPTEGKSVQGLRELAKKFQQTAYVPYSRVAGPGKEKYDKQQLNRTKKNEFAAKYGMSEHKMVVIALIPWLNKYMNQVQAKEKYILKSGKNKGQEGERPLFEMVNGEKVKVMGPGKPDRWNYLKEGNNYRLLPDKIYDAALSKIERMKKEGRFEELKEVGLGSLRYD